MQRVRAHGGQGAAAGPDQHRRGLPAADRHRDEPVQGQLHARDRTQGPGVQVVARGKGQRPDAQGQQPRAEGPEQRPAGVEDVVAGSGGFGHRRRRRTILAGWSTPRRRTVAIVGGEEPERSRRRRGPLLDGSRSRTRLRFRRGRVAQHVAHGRRHARSRTADGRLPRTTARLAQVGARVHAQPADDAERVRDERSGAGRRSGRAPVEDVDLVDVEPGGRRRRGGRWRGRRGADVARERRQVGFGQALWTRGRPSLATPRALDRRLLIRRRPPSPVCRKRKKGKGSRPRWLCPDIRRRRRSRLGR